MKVYNNCSFNVVIVLSAKDAERPFKTTKISSRTCREDIYLPIVNEEDATSPLSGFRLLRSPTQDTLILETRQFKQVVENNRVFLRYVKDVGNNICLYAFKA